MLGLWLIDQEGKPQARDFAPILSFDVDKVSSELVDLTLAIDELRGTPAPPSRPGQPEPVYRHAVTLDYDTVTLDARPAGNHLLVLVVEPGANIQKVRSLCRLLMLRITRELPGSATR